MAPRKQTDTAALAAAQSQSTPGHSPAPGQPTAQGQAAGQSTAGPSGALGQPRGSKDQLDEFSEVIIKITNAFSQTFNTCVDRLIDSLDKKLNMRLDIQETSIFDINKRIDRLEKANLELRNENQMLKDSVNTMAAKLEQVTQSCDDIDQYSRGSNILIHGVPSPPGNAPEPNLAMDMTNLLNTHLNVSISLADVNLIHRLPRTNTAASASGRPKPPPIIIQFINKQIRNQILANRKLLKGKGFSITEQLTSRKATLLRKASELVTASKLLSAWSHEGKVLVKTLANHTVPITCLAELLQY